MFSFFPYLSAKKGNSVFSRSSANFGEDSRSRGVIKSIPRGIEEWKNVRDLEDRGTRNSSCHPYIWLQLIFSQKPLTFCIPPLNTGTYCHIGHTIPKKKSRCQILCKIQWEVSQNLDISCKNFKNLGENQQFNQLQCLVSNGLPHGVWTYDGQN